MGDWNALADALESARPVPEILDAVARIAYANAHDGAECPPDATPTPDQLAAAVALRELPESAMTEGHAALSAMLGAGSGWTVVLSPDPDGEPIARWLPDDIKAPAPDNPWSRERYRPVLLALDPGKQPRTIEAVHAAWLAIPEADPPRPRHPLAPLVAAWLARPANRDPFDLRSRASLPRLHRIAPSEAAQLPAFPGSNLPDPGRQLDLPGFGPSVAGCPSWMLWMFDAAGGESMKQGRGAPWPMRLFVGALVHVAVPDRTGRWVTLRFPTLRRHEADWPVPGVRAVETWLHPEAWANFRRDWTLLPAALDSMRERLSYVPVPGFGSVAMVFPSVIPRAPCDPMVEFTVRIPASAAHGARADWEFLCRYGAVSAALYRAYLSTVAYFDHSARAGHPITADIAAPVLDDEGNPKRRKGGAIIRSSHDTVPNPAARYVAPLTDADLARMIGFDGDNRDHRRQARRAFERLEADGIFDMQRKGSGVSLFGPRKGAR